MSTTQYLIVPAWSDQASQCRIVRREHETKHPDPLQHYRQFPEQWKEAGHMNSRGVVVALDASAEVLQEFRDCEPLMAGTVLSFPTPTPAPSLGVASIASHVDFQAFTELVAADFALALEGEIGEAALAEVVARNQVEPSGAICHSHDHCDANVLMAAAIMARCGVDAADEGVLQGGPVNALWDEAWGLAKARFFSDTDLARNVSGVAMLAPAVPAP